MSLTWRGEPEPVPAWPSVSGWLRVGLRVGPILLLLLLGLVAKAAVRVIEAPLCHPRCPVSPWITMVVCRGVLRLLGLRVRVEGQPMSEPGAIVANHSSWLDIFVLNARAPVVFVSKAEIAGWPGIGFLARATGTLFIRREARGDAARQAGAVADRLRAGQTLLFFPEGTSSDNRRVLPFKPALFEGLLAPDLPEGLSVQPVTLAYEAPRDEDPRFYAWWGDAEFGPHALSVLAARRSGRVRVVFHSPIPVSGRGRKALAAAAEAAVQSAL